jgi:hypothetical protein
MINWGHVAGFFDGEGNLHRDRRTSTVQSRFDNTCEEVVREIQKFIKHGRISNRGREKPHHKDRFRLTIANHSEVLEVLEKMFPHLVVKKRAAETLSVTLMVENGDRGTEQMALHRQGPPSILNSSTLPF